MNRPSIERLFLILQMLEGGRVVPAGTLAVELDVSQKTIFRDMDFLRDRLQVPIQATHLGYSVENCRCPFCKRAGTHHHSKQL